LCDVRMKTLHSAPPVSSHCAPGRYAFVSRFLDETTPNLLEDPVTGRAHCALMPYWAAALATPPATRLLARQASARGACMARLFGVDASDD
jgi:predicted PhzF superfamily epimerase YddE/YHI9